MRSFWVQPEGTRRFSRRALSADLAVLLDIGCVVLLALYEKHSRRSRIKSDRLLGQCFLVARRVESNEQRLFSGFDYRPFDDAWKLLHERGGFDRIQPLLALGR